MPKFRVSNTVPCFVTWEYEIDAANEHEAREKYREGDYMQTAEYIGDSIDGVAESIDIARIEA